MTPNIRFKLISFLVPAIASVVFLAWWLSPTQQVKRAAGGVMDAVEVRLLSSETPEQRTARLVSLFADPATVAIEGQIQGQSLSHDEIIEAHQRLQERVTGCRITAEDAEVRFPAPGQAEYEAPMEVEVRVGQNFRKIYRYQTILSFQKSGKTWILNGVSAAAR